MSLRENLLLPGAMREILRGEFVDWTPGDWFAALVYYPWLDAQKIAVHLLLDHTGSFGWEIVNEVLVRRSMAKARATGAEVFCVFPRLRHEGVP